MQLALINLKTTLTWGAVRGKSDGQASKCTEKAPNRKQIARLHYAGNLSQPAAACERPDVAVRGLQTLHRSPMGLSDVPQWH